MNNQFMWNQNNNNNEQASLAQLKGILENVFDGVHKDEQKTLITIIDIVQKILIKKFLESPSQVRPREYNLSSAIYEKCLLLKNKNEELKIKVLNLRASLSKMMSHSKQSSQNQRVYTDIVDDIRKRGFDVKAKIEKYRGNNVRVPRLINNDLLKSRGVNELKKGAEWLLRRTLEMRREVEVCREYCMNQSSYRD